MPREVEYEVNGRWYRSGLFGPEGIRATHAAGLPARYIGGVLQVNAKMNNQSPHGWVGVSATHREMTPEEYEALYPELDARLVPYEGAQAETWTYKAVETKRTPSGPAPEVPGWKQARDLSLAPGECPCGILRAMCDYHR